MKKSIHILLFVLTFFSLTLSGAENGTGEFLLMGNISNWEVWLSYGLQFAISFITFLTFHEFGHYLMAKKYGIKASLPYYIPAPFLNYLFGFSIGTFGAVIRLKEPVPSTRKLFDVGVAGPLAGFVVALLVLWVGFLMLPPPSDLLRFEDAGHKALTDFIRANGHFPANHELHLSGALTLGNTLLFSFMASFFPNTPPMYELYHYPLLFAGWLGLFFTALNMLPVGQLDGGHVWYALVGEKWHGRIARLFTGVLVFISALGAINEIIEPLYQADFYQGILGLGIMIAVLGYLSYAMFKEAFKAALFTTFITFAVLIIAQFFPILALSWGNFGWFIWCLMIVFFIGLDHPPVQYPEPLDFKRKVLAILSIVIFILCFTPAPMYIQS